MSAVELPDAVSKLCDQLTSAEQRVYKRHPFLTLQRIAPLNDEGQANTADFCEVQCLDISAGGFAFITAKPPTYRYLAIALGVRPNLTCMKAEVVQVCEVESQGHIMVRVGCHFVGRLSSC